MLSTADVDFPKGQFPIFLKSKETSVNSYAEDYLEGLIGFLDMDRTAVFDLLVKELDKPIAVAGVMVKDGLYAHPEALGKVLLKLKLKELER